MNPLKNRSAFIGRKKLFLAVSLFAVLFFAVGAGLGTWLGQPGSGLSSRLERRFGSGNVTGVSCEQTGPELHITADLTFIPEETGNFLERSQFYQSACLAARGELLSDTAFDHVRTMRLTFRYGGKTTATILSDRYHAGDVEPFCMFRSEKPGASFSMVLD